MSKGTPYSSHLTWMEDKIKKLEEQIQKQARELAYFRTKYPHPYPEELEDENK